MRLLSNKLINQKTILGIVLVLIINIFLLPVSAVDGFGDGMGMPDPGGGGGCGDLVAPIFTSTSPLDNSSGVSVSSNLILGFDETVSCVATKNLSIYKTSDYSLVTTIDVTDGQVTGCDTSSITVNPSSDLLNSTSYYIQIDSGAFKDACNNNYAGIADQITWNFTTEAGADITSPTVTSFSPADNSIGVSTSTNLIITFNENIAKGTGNIIIKKNDGSTIETIDVTTAKVTVSSNSATINPDSALDNLTDYYILIDSTAFEDLAGNDYSGINISTTWNFKTAGVSGSGWYYPGQWLKRIKISIDESQVKSNLTDFPVYVDLSDLSGTNFFNYVKSDGSDIRVTTSSGDTEIPREIVFIDTLNQKGEIHFKADGTLSGSANTDFYIYYDNASATEPAEGSTYGAQNVWTNNFSAVWHMAQAQTASVMSLFDSTANNNDGTPVSGATLVNNSLVGKSISFNDSYIDIPANASMYPSNVSLLTISKADKLYLDNTNNTVANMLFQKGSGTAYDGYLQYVLPEGGTYTSGYSTDARARFKVAVGKGDKYDWVTANKAILSATNWHVVQSSYNNSGSKEFRLYQLGNLDKEELTTGSLSATNATSRIAQAPSFLSSDEYFRGQIDEIRYSSVQRSSDWMFSEFVSLACPHIFYLVDDTRPSGYYIFTLTSRSPLNNATDVTETGLVLSLTFNSNVYPNTGNLYLKRYSDDAVIETIDVLGNQVSGYGTNTLSFSINSTLATGVKYYVTYDANLIIDSCGQLTGILSDKDTWSFTSAAPPTVTGLSPADNAIDVLPSTNLVMTFSENVQAGTGNITIKKSSDNSTVQTISITNPAVNFSGNQVTINPPSDLLASTSYYINIASTTITDASGNAYAGILDSSSWNFTTAGYPEVYATDPPVTEPVYKLEEAKVEFTKNIVLDPGSSNVICRVGSYAGSVIYTQALSNAQITNNPKEIQLPSLTQAFYSAPGYPLYCSIEGSAIKSDITNVGKPTEYQFEFNMSPTPFLP
jgi:methionine-rich copper-binding protein CopC